MKKRKSLFPRGLLLAMAAALLASPALRADGFIVIPHPPRPGPATPFPLEVVRHDVRVEIDGQVATTFIDQEFYNPNPWRLEGEYLFPLPTGAVIKKFSMWIDGRETQAELLDAAKARGIYEDIVRRLRDPALLEYDGRGVFRMRVYPIEPRGRKRIKISYHEVLERSNGAVSYLYPLNTEKFSSRAIPEVSIVVNIHSPEVLASVHCPTHPVHIARPGRGRATVSYSARDSLPDSDFRLFFTPAGERLGISLLAFRPAGQDGTFLLSVSPGGSWSGSGKEAKDIVFAVDTSGSMSGRAMEQAREAMRHCLERLNRGDRFNVVRFATEGESLFRGLQPATQANVARAREFVSGWQAAGGTNCEEALKLALEASGDSGTSGRLRTVVLVTDGRPTIGETGEEALLRLVARGGARLRIFPVAIGSEINTHLLDKIAAATRTFRTYIAVNEDISGGIARFFDTISFPALSDLRLDMPAGIGAAQVHPRDLPDLYRGSTLTVAGRYRGSGPATITLSGSVNGRSESFPFRADFPAESLDHDFLPPIWGARRVGFLLDQIRLHGQERELVEEVTRLARQFGIVTPYTSYLIVEDEKGRLRRGELNESDMTVGGLPGAPARAGRHREEFSAMKDKSGASSVRASTELQKLHQAAAVNAARPESGATGELSGQVKSVQGVAFYLNNGTWIDGRIQEIRGRPLTRIAFASAEYFALLKKHPRLASALALGRSIRFVLAGRIFEVFDPGSLPE
ncbi:MAG: VWA domain-containing protein [Candidatus Aminicenantes bacterium]|nr:VWA domain-containing protein [Candidatus Aminicenantes bacterium]